MNLVKAKAQQFGKALKDQYGACSVVSISALLPILYYQCYKAHKIIKIAI